MPNIYTLTDKVKTSLIVQLDIGEEAVCPVCGEKELDESTRFEEPEHPFTDENWSNRYFTCKHSFFSVSDDLDRPHYVVLPLKYKDPDQETCGYIPTSEEEARK